MIIAPLSRTVFKICIQHKMILFFNRIELALKAPITTAAASYPELTKINHVKMH